MTRAPTPVPDPNAPTGQGVPFDPGIEARARLAAALGVLAVALIMVAPCACFGTVPVAGAMGAGGFMLGLRARSADPCSPAGRAYGVWGAITGGTAVVLFMGAALIFLLIVGFYGSAGFAGLSSI